MDAFTKEELENGFAPVAASQQHALDNMPIADVLKYREKLISEYHGGVRGLVEKLEANKDADMDFYLLTFIKEVIRESDHLLGNEQLAMNNGDLRDASVISFKRTEVIEKAIKAVQTRQQIEMQSGIDVESPSMIVIFRYFLGKCKEALDKMAVGNEVNDLFFATFGEVTENWQKELRRQFDELRQAPQNNNPIKRR